MTAATHDQRRKTLIAMGLTGFAYALFNIGDAALKMLTQGTLHFSQIIISNCAIIILCTATVGWLRQGKKAFVMQNPKLILTRACMSAIVSVLNTVALPHIKLTTFYTLVFTSPFWVALLAAAFLKEKLEPVRVAVIMTGFAAVAFVFRPGAGMFDVWSLCILAGAFFYSCGLIALRKMGPGESRTMIIIIGSLVSMTLVAPFYPSHYQPLTLQQWELFGLMGSLGAVSVTCIAYAFQTASAASAVAPFHYTQIIWGALLGYYLFDEIPDSRVIGGAACIIGAGLYLIFSEARRKHKVVEELPETAAST